MQKLGPRKGVRKTNRFDCAVNDSSNKNDTTGECVWVKKGHAPCNYGRFATVCHEHIKPLADYKIREYASGSLKATVHGKRGMVEVWGGDGTATEVYVIERRTKRETRITGKWWIRPLKGVLLEYAPADHMSLDDALAKAFALAGVQTRLAF